MSLPVLIPLDSGSIGHFVRDFDIMERNIDVIRKNSGINRSLVYVARSYICNSYFLKLISEQRRVVNYFPYFTFHRVLSRFNRDYSILLQKISDKSIEYLTKWHESPPVFVPPKTDINFIKSGLSKKLKLERPLIVLVIRDSGYDLSRQTYTQDNELSNRLKYRNTPISWFQSSIDLLISKGYSVIRVGRHSNTDLKYRSPHYYDYSIDIDSQSDMADVIIPYLAEFTISTGSGIDEFSNFYRKPIYRVNVAPPGTNPKSLISKLMLISDYFCSSTQERLSIEEVVLSDLNTMNPTLLMQQRGIFVKPKGEEAIFEFITTVIEYHNSVFSNVSKFELQSSFYKSAEGFESSLSRYKDFYY